MRRWLQTQAPGIGTRLTAGIGVLVFFTLTVVTLAFVAGREATRDIEASEAVRAPAALTAAQAQEALLRMQLNVRGYLVLSDPANIEQYHAARMTFESGLAALQRSSRAWDEDDGRRVQALTEKYALWKKLPPQLFDLHDNPLRNRPALRLSRVDVQSQRVRVMAEVEAMIALQKARPAREANAETMAAMVAFQSSIDAMTTNVIAYGASGDNGFRLNYAPQLVANAALWDALLARRPSLTPAQREQLDRIGRARQRLTESALEVRAILEGDRAFEDLYLYRTQVVPQSAALLDLLRQVTARQQQLLQGELAHARKSLARARTWTLTGGALALVFGIVMAFLLRRSIVEPVRRLTAVAGRIAGGQLEARAPVEARDEIGRLAESFNIMTDRLAETIARLEAAYGEASQAKDAAETANRAKSAFLATMSHELRTPLNAILGYAQMLQHAQGLQARDAKGVDIIRRSGEHLLLLINDVLDLARIEAGKVDLDVQVTDLPVLLHTVCDIVRVEAQRKGLAFTYEVVGDLPRTVYADDKRLRQVLLNLVNNAVKFTAQGSVSLRVSALASDGQRTRLRFEVVDTGIGIAADQLARLFQPFEQASGVQRRFGGAGLGLAICRQLVQLMDSDIRVDSREGAGSRFWFELELPLATPAAAPDAPATEDIVGYEGRRRCVLIVDDLPANRMPLVQALTRLGFGTMEAAHGGDALSQIEQAPPDLVLMDSVMPVMDGPETVRRLRSDEHFRALPIIMVSANASEADREASLQVGADAFIAKPVDFARLLGEIARLLGVRWVRRGAVAEAGPPPAPLVPPPPEELEVLVRLARIGNMRSIRERAEQLGALDKRFQPLAERLCTLAEGYESAAITELLAAMQQQGRLADAAKPAVAS
ncbi:ATP-binding protein [Aquabacterium humicola]|uniref:ATP-binding protein n=1 Tax=Aquabacterium humicola TaxID=3237377 RepID=UPI0025429BEC|nr:ATP-binding protein [Rubrivivax pictus]